MSARRPNREPSDQSQISPGLTIVALGLLTEPREECLADEGVSPVTAGSRRKGRRDAYFSRCITKTRVSGCQFASKRSLEGAMADGKRSGR